MKKLIIFVFLAFIGLRSFSQSLELFYKGEPIRHITDISITANFDSGKMILDSLGVKNTSDVALNVVCIKETIENKEGAVNSFCWGGQCYPPFVDTASKITTIDPQRISYEFSADHDPNGTEGKTKVKFTFYNPDNPKDNTAVFVNYEVSESNSNAKKREPYTLSKAYPNPANNVVCVDFHLNTMSDARIAFYNLLGSKVKEIELTNSFGTVTINTSDFIEGIYFYSLLINHEVLQTQKLIIKH